MGIRDSKDDKLKGFWREGWDIESHPGFPLSYDLHRGRKFIAMDRSKFRGWFHQAVQLQESLLVSPHELVEKVKVRGSRLSHVNAQIAVKTIALHKTRKSALDVGFGERDLDWEVGNLADEYAIEPGRDMIRYVCLGMGGYSPQKQQDILKRMVHWGRWDEKDLIEAITTGFFQEAQEYVEAHDILNLAKLLEQHSQKAEQQVAEGKGKDKGNGKGKKGETDVEEKGKGKPEYESASERDKWIKPTHPINDNEWWAPMKVVQPPLVAAQDIIKKVYVRRSTDAGVAVGDVSRVLTDQKVFREPRPTIKGSVLIDASGSMGLSHAEIFEICGKIPGAIIGVYTGMHSAGYGKLIVAAINGRILERKRLVEERKGGGANMVDGPALEWLCSQPRPRVWVSDGAVTGRNECTNDALIEDANRICLRGNVVRIHALKQAPGVITFLRGKKGI